MEQALNALVAAAENRYGSLVGSHASPDDKLQAIVRQKRMPKNVKRGLKGAVSAYRNRRKLPDDEIDSMLRSLAARAPSKTRSGFELNTDEFPELGSGMPVLALPDPDPKAHPTPCTSMLCERHNESQWFRDSTGMVYFGAPPPESVHIVATGRMHNGILVGLG